MYHENVMQIKPCTVVHVMHFPKNRAYALYPCYPNNSYWMIVLLCSGLPAPVILATDGPFLGTRSESTPDLPQGGQNIV